MAEKRVSVRMSAEGGGQVRAEFQGVGTTGSQELARIERQADVTGAVLTRVMGILGAAVSVRELVRYADTWTDLRARVDLATGSQEAGAAVMGRLTEMARRTYSSLGQTVESYLQNATALRELGMSTRQSLDFTEALNNAIVVSGARQERAAQISNALSQAMALGRLQGDQLNTILRNGGRVAELLASELGVGTNQLRQLGAQGRITGDVIRRALIGNLEQLREEADSMPATIGDAFTLMGNAALGLIGRWDQLLGSSAAVAQAIIALADNLERVASYAVGFAVFMGVRWVWAFVAAAGSVNALVAALTLLRTALIRTGIGALIIGVGELIHQFARLVRGAGGFGAAFRLVMDVVRESGRRIGQVFSMIGAASASVFFDMIADALAWADDTIDAVLAWGNAAINTFRGAYAAIEVIWGALPGAIGDYAFQAANALVEGVEGMLNGAAARIDSFIHRMNAALEWMGSERRISLIGGFELGRIDNPYAGAAAEMGEAARAAFQAAFEATPIEIPDFGLVGTLAEARALAEEYRQATFDIAGALTLPLESWQALMDALERADAVADGALEDADAAARRLAEQLARAGAAGRQAGQDSKAGAHEATTGWLAAAEAVRKYAAETADLAGQIGQSIVGAFRSAENAVADFVRTGKFDFASFTTSILADMARIATRRFILGPIANAMSGLFQGWGAAAIGKAGASIALPSFDGGGYTGWGARAGGLDGKGGFAALLHPQERVIDESRGQGRFAQASPVYVNIATPDVRSFQQSRGQIAADIARAVQSGRRNL